MTKKPKKTPAPPSAGVEKSTDATAKTGAVLEPNGSIQAVNTPNDSRFKVPPIGLNDWRGFDNLFQPSAINAKDGLLQMIKAAGTSRAQRKKPSGNRVGRP